jgi:hypothetical protein
MFRKRIFYLKNIYLLKIKYLNKIFYFIDFALSDNLFINKFL